MAYESLCILELQGYKLSVKVFIMMDDNTTGLKTN